MSVTSLRSSYGPIRHPDFVRLISWLSYRVYLLLRFLVGTTRASPVAWCILAAMLSLSPRRSTTTYQSLFHSCCSAFAAIQAVRPPVFDVSRLSLRSLLLRPGSSLTVQMTALLMSFRKLGFPPFCHSSYVVVILATVGFSPLNTPAFAGHTESASTPYTRSGIQSCLMPLQGILDGKMEVVGFLEYSSY